ncbi:hypothetical protein QCA50_020720 [Cerrena zonata]|uniref:Protein kinase domain-containing protein n=1 Tax=Cerrena zonata TaxID=2478898 RepID=A0AAW0FBN5_9APHY
MTEAARRDKLNMTIPILDTLPFSENWSFIVMPRWGSTSGLQRWGFNDIRTAFHYMSSVLKSLVFLHQNLIVHRDIRPDNILINCITNRVVTDLRPFLDSGHAKFALCDFGLSFKFPPDTPLEERLRPSIDCCIGTLEYQPPDGTDGEAFYDPFAFDVACLGGVFCELVGHLTTLVNPLAPFLDRMVTHDISARYTAEEALRALTQLEAQLSPECLTTRVMRPPVGPLAKEYCPCQAYNRWSDLPLSFIAQHPAPPSSMKSKSYDDDWKPYFDVYPLEASFLKLFAA